MAEQLISQEPSRGPSPTNLDLFRYAPSRKESITYYGSELENFKKLVDANNRIWAQKEANLHKTDETLLDGLSLGLYNLFYSISSLSVGLAYLKFVDGFKPQGATDQEVYDLFRKCLEVAMPLTANIVKAQTSSGSIAAGIAANNYDFSSHRLEPLVNKIAQNIPPWFKGTKEQFLRTVRHFSSFTEILHPDLSEAQVNAILIKSNQNMKKGLPFETILGSVTREGLPDWLSDEDRPPSRETVEIEAKEDKEELESIKLGLQTIQRRRIFLKEQYAGKKDKANIWINENGQKLTLQNERLAEVVLRVGILGDLPLLKHFTESPLRLKDPETLGLFIEDILKTAGIVVGGLITEDGKNLLEVYIRAQKPDASDSEKDKFKAYRDVNKKAYNSLNFDLGGFISSLSSEDLDLISEFLGVTKTDANSLIFFISDVITDRLKNIDESKLDKVSPLRKSLSLYRDFLNRFMRNNLNWLYDELRIAINSQGSDIRHEAVERAPGVETEHANNIVNISTQQAIEFEEETDKVLQGSLGNWKVSYKINGSQIQVEGSSLSDKSVFLDNFFVKNGISCSVGSKSIINALDWKVNAPKEAEFLVPTKEINGEDWKKMKRGAVRIFYQMDSEGKKVTFFVYQKKDWYYRL